MTVPPPRPAGKLAFPLVLAALAALCGALFLVLFEDARRTEIARLGERQRIHARQAASGIEEYFRNWTAVLSSLARIDDVAAVTPDGRAYMDFFLEAHGDQIRSITRVDEHGVILYTAPHGESIGRDISAQKHVQTMLATRRPVVSDLFRAVQGFEGIAIHVPVFRGGVFKGSVATVVDFEKVTKRYLDVVRIGESGYAWAVGEDGTILYSPIAGFPGRTLTDVARGNPALLAMAGEMLAGREGAATYPFDRIGDRKVAPFRKHSVYLPVRLGNTFWSVAVTSSEDDVVAALASFRNRLAAGMAVALLVAAGVSAAGTKAWMIVRESRARERAEEVLRESEGRYRELFERNPAPMLIYEKGSYRMLAVNDAFRLHYGYDDADIAGMRLPDLYPEDEKERITTLASTLSGVAYVGEWHHLKKDGQAITIVVRSHDIVYKGVPGRVGVITDISERKKAENLLRELNETLENKVHERTAELEAANARLSGLDRLKSQFIASMSHELRTPLNSIIGFTGILLQGLAGPLNPEQSKQLGMVKASARHLLDLITDIIDLSKIEAGKVGLNIERVDVAKIARGVLEEFRVAAGQKSLALSIDAPETLSADADARRVRQVLINLVGNAVKFTDSGSVSLAVARTGGVASISVRDTGPGIRPGDIGKLFRQFSQVGLDGAVKHEGTGLGLYLSRKLMDGMGGDLRVESAFGRGSVFTATLPLPREETA